MQKKELDSTPLVIVPVRSADDARACKGIPPRFRRMIQLLLRHEFAFEHESLCDLGCGVGVLSYWLREHFPTCKIHAADNAPNLAEVHSSCFDYRVCDLARGFPFEDRTMAVVFAAEIIEHMIDTDFFLDECIRILEPGGYLVLTTPNICMLRNRIRVPLGLHPRATEYRNVIHHVRFYNGPLMKRDLTERGFQEIEMSCVNMLPQRWLQQSRLARRFSDWLSDLVPNLGSNLVALAKRLES